MSSSNAILEIQDDIYLSDVMQTLELYKRQLDEQNQENRSPSSDPSSLHWLLRIASQMASARKTC